MQFIMYTSRQDSGSSRLPSCGPHVRRRPNFPPVDSDACQWAWQRSDRQASQLPPASRPSQGGQRAYIVLY